MKKDELALALTLKEGELISGKVVKIYAATRNEDTNSGRGIRIDNSYHKTEKSALIGCRGIDVMGTDGKVAHRLAIKLSDGRYFPLPDKALMIVVVSDDDEVQAAADLRAKVLDKLSVAERAALGL